MSASEVVTFFSTIVLTFEEARLKLAKVKARGIKNSRSRRSGSRFFIDVFIQLF